MQKYKLINKNTGEEHLCNKVTIDEFDYYVSDETIEEGWKGTAYKKDVKGKIFKHFYTTNTWYNDAKIIVACNNPNLNIPKIIEYSDILEDMAVLSTEENEIDDSIEYGHRLGFINGYKKYQETHPFSEEDVKEIFKIAQMQKNYGDYKPYTFEEAMKLWKEQKVNTLYYE